jgi:hypothetical protein
MANRFTWAWKLAELGKPVILVYLGFTGCDEMKKGKCQKPILNKDEWDELVYSHSRPLFPKETWNREWRICRHALIPLIRTYDLSLCDMPTGQ